MRGIKQGGKLKLGLLATTETICLVMTIISSFAAGSQLAWNIQERNASRLKVVSSNMLQNFIESKKLINRMKMSLLVEKKEIMAFMTYFECKGEKLRFEIENWNKRQRLKEAISERSKKNRRQWRWMLNCSRCIGENATKEIIVVAFYLMWTHKNDREMQKQRSKNAMTGKAWIALDLWTFDPEEKVSYFTRKSQAT